MNDGRHIDTSLAILSGEAGELTRGRTEEAEPWARTPTVERGDPTYYDRPLLKESVWEWDIPAYYYLGGAAGAALALGAAAQLSGDRSLDRFARHCHWIGIAGSSAGAALLIHDLGRPSRFLHMMRVFRPTSPMNLGTWILSGAAPLAMAAGLLPQALWVSRAAGYGAGLFGIALAGYTGVLVSNTAIPVLNEARRLMPVLFFASSMASAASVLDLCYDDLHYDERRARRIVFLFGTAGRVVELAAAHGVEAEASRTPRVGRPLREGASGALWKLAAACTAASLVVSLIPGESKGRRRVAGVLGTLGSLCLRFAVHEAGKASARDARASFHLQRGRMAPELE